MQLHCAKYATLPEVQLHNTAHCTKYTTLAQNLGMGRDDQLVV